LYPKYDFEKKPSEDGARAPGKELTTVELVNKIDEAILFDDPQRLINLNLSNS